MSQTPSRLGSLSALLTSSWQAQLLRSQKDIGGRDCRFASCFLFIYSFFKGWNTPINSITIYKFLCSIRFFLTQGGFSGVYQPIFSLAKNLACKSKPCRAESRRLGLDGFAREVDTDGPGGGFSGEVSWFGGSFQILENPREFWRIVENPTKFWRSLENSEEF